MFLNRIVLIVISYFLNTSSFANESIVWIVEGHKTEIYFDQKLEVMLSGDCREKKCGARIFFAQAKIIQVEKNEDDGTKNPGSYLCQKLNGVVVIATNEMGSQNAFCQAADKSLVNLSSL